MLSERTASDCDWKGHFSNSSPVLTNSMMFTEATTININGPAAHDRHPRDNTFKNDFYGSKHIHLM